MTHDEIKTAWDVQADEHNQWDSLSEDEKVEWAFSLALKYHPELEAWYVTGCSTLRVSSVPSTKAELDAAVDRVIAAQAKNGEQANG